MNVNQTLPFDNLASKRVELDFAGGHLSSDGGVLLLRQVNRALGITRHLAQCFGDARNPDLIDHSIQQLLDQRIYGLALGYEDLNDHDDLRRDHLLATACEKSDPLGKDRRLPEHRGTALASSATLNRLELSNCREGGAHKMTHDPEKIQQCLLEMGVRCLDKHTKEVILDLDAMGHALHGMQEGRHFNAYYDTYCYLPLYVFVGDVPLWVQLRTADHGTKEGVVPAMERILAAIRKRLPKARVILRADSGFCCDKLMTWCEAQKEVYYCVGMGKNPVLLRHLAATLARARAQYCLVGGATTRVFGEFDYQTLKSWSRARRMIGKAEVGHGGDNPRFVVTNLPKDGFKEDEDKQRFESERLYEQLYCARGEMENVLKQQVLDLEGDRMSTHHLVSNQLRLWLSTFAYMLLQRVRALGCQGTELARATAGTLRLRLLKVAAQVKVTERRVHVQLSSAYPLRELFERIHARLRALGAPGS